MLVKGEEKDGRRIFRGPEEVAMFSEKQVGALRAFAEKCYWHCENTGDENMTDIDGALSELWAAFEAAREAEEKKEEALDDIRGQVRDLRDWVTDRIGEFNVRLATVENKQREMKSTMEYHDIVIRALQGSYMELLKKGAGL